MRFWVSLLIFNLILVLIAVVFIFHTELSALLSFQFTSKVSTTRFITNPAELQKAVDSTKLSDKNSLLAGLEKIRIEILDETGLKVLNYGVLVNSQTQAKKIAYGFYIDQQNKLLTINIAVDFSAYPNKADREAILNKWVLLAIKQISQNRFDRESMTEILNQSMNFEPAQIPKIIIQVQ